MRHITMIWRVSRIALRSGRFYALSIKRWVKRMVKRINELEVQMERGKQRNGSRSRIGNAGVVGTMYMMGVADMYMYLMPLISHTAYISIDVPRHDYL
jgi:hypothetical protein